MSVDGEYEFPQELLMQGSALVGVSGLDTANSGVHKTVWDALSNGRTPDRPPVHFRLLPHGHRFPRPASKRTQYEMHVPKGIVKRGWMKKHLNEVPAVVAVFYDLDWDDPHWEEKKLDCASKLQAVRSRLEGRATRVCVVLVQRSLALPSGEDLLAAERASALFHAADLTNKSLFILPHTENLYGFTARLEKAFFELASGYYQHEIKGVKLHREQLSKKTQQYLFVRHQFKMGFFSELKQDLFGAHNHYSEAYSQLLEVRVSESNEFEVKTVAGFLVYKVCRLNFLLERAREAVSQFKAHIEHYRHRTGPPPLLFQHHAWLSKQLRMFGDLFDEMVSGRCGPAVQSQHPGYYYQLAARHAAERRRAAGRFSGGGYPAPDPLRPLDSLDYYGQRPWRAAAEPLDPDRERNAHLAVQWLENNAVDHSGIIIGLLGNAISQFKTYRCPRMRRHLVVQMAEEYQSSKDYGKALTLLCHMLWDYRGEGWWAIVDAVLERALAAAYLTASLPEYAALLYETASRRPQDPAPFDRLIALTRGGMPGRPGGLTEEEEREAEAAWGREKEGESVTVDTSALRSALDVKASITSASYDLVRVRVLVRSELSRRVEFSSLAVVTSGGSGSVERLVAAHLSLDRGVADFSLQFAPDPQDVGKILQISSVVLKLNGEGDKGRSIYFKFTGQGCDTHNTHRELIHFRSDLFIYKVVCVSVGRITTGWCRRGSVAEGEFRETCAVRSLAVARRSARVSLAAEAEGPALLPEWLPLAVTVHSLEEEHLPSLTLTLALTLTLDPDDSRLDTTTEFRVNGSEECVSAPVSVTLDGLPPAHKSVTSFLMRANSLHPRHLHFKVSYETAGGERCSKERSLTVEVAEPFKWSSECLNGRLESLASRGVDTHTRFLVHAALQSLSPYPLRIESTAFLPRDNFESDGEYVCAAAGTVLHRGEAVALVAALTTAVASERPAHAATLVVNWSRCKNGEGGSQTAESKAAVGEVSRAVRSLVRVEAAGGAGGSLRSLLPLTYTITNLTPNLYTVHLLMDTSDAFMFSGHKQAVVHVLPGEERRLSYNLYPLLCGWLRLPRLSLTSAVDSLPQASLARALDALPTLVYVLPLKKESGGGGGGGGDVIDRKV